MINTLTGEFTMRLYEFQGPPTDKAKKFKKAKEQVEALEEEDLEEVEENEPKPRPIVPAIG